MALTKTTGSMIANSAAYGVVGCNCNNNSATPNTQFDLDADVVVLRASDGSSVVRFEPGAAITNNISTSGPAANGRDQSGAFDNNSWVHFYWIWNGTTLATISSAAAPPTGPTLPSGYTHWAYAGAVFADGSGNLKRVYIKGSTVYYAAQQAALSDGQADSETAVGLTAIVPPNALSWFAHHSGAPRFGTNEYQLRILSGSDYWDQLGAAEGSGIRRWASGWFPNVGQNVYYIWASTPGASSGLDLFIQAFKIPNGGE